MNAARDVVQPYRDEDRQRRNLAQFVDLGDLVRAWREGNVTWDTQAWGPDPDDVGCLLSNRYDGGEERDLMLASIDELQRALGEAAPR